MEIFKPTAFIAVDTETTGLDVRKGDAAFAVSACDEEGNTWYCEWPVDPFTREIAPKEKDLEFLRRYLEDDNLPKVFHNAKFDLRMLAKAGLQVKGQVHDTHIMARVAYTQEMSYGLKQLAWKYFRYPMDDQKELKQWANKARAAGRKKGWKLSEDVEADYWMVRAAFPNNDICEEYARKDALRTALLYHYYLEKLESDGDLYDKYDDEMELMLVVMRMENRGMYISRDRCIEELAKAVAKQQQYLQDMRKMSGHPDFNPASPQQLAYVLYGPKHDGCLGLECFGYTDKGAPSTDGDALRLHMSHPFVRTLFGWRACKKGIEFFETYMNNMCPDALSEGHCIHTDLDQVGAKTGRFSCRKPNLQQVTNPEASARGMDFIPARVPFGPRPGYIWWALDYAQQEVRIYADIAEIQLLLDALYAGRDVNTEIANRAWGGKGNLAALQAAAQTLDLGNPLCENPHVLAVWKQIGWNPVKCKHGVYSQEAAEAADRWLAMYDYDIVKGEKDLDMKRTRNKGKIIMFTKIYGGGAKAAMSLLYCTEAEARKTMKEFDRTFPGINRYATTLTKEARAKGYIINRYGRKLHVEPEFAYRCVNYMVQGTAADMMKDAIRRCDAYLRKTRLDAHVLMTIHDELIFEVKKEHAHKWLLRGLKQIMEDNGGRLQVPMLVDPNIVTESWGEKAELKLKPLAEAK